MTQHLQNLPSSSRVALPMETREVAITNVNSDDRTIEVIWTTGASGKRRDWVTGETYIEELVVTEAAVRLERLNAGGPVLDNHRVYGGISGMLAVVERAWIEGSEGKALVRFPKAEDDTDVDKIFRKIKDKIITRLSCGYKRHKIEVDRTKEPKVWRVVDWEPYELSFVVVPFDLGAKTRNEDAETYDCEIVRSPKSSASNALTRMRLARKRRASSI